MGALGKEINSKWRDPARINEATSKMKLERLYYFDREQEMGRAFREKGPGSQGYSPRRQ